MAPDAWLLAVLLGVLQGTLEWLPISSEGNVALVLALVGAAPGDAVRYALFLHLGTALAATAYYRDPIAELLAEALAWRPGRASAELRFLVVATVLSGFVGVAAYLALSALVGLLAGGAFIALIGALLLLTGLLQRLGAGAVHEGTVAPDGLDAVLVGVGQGLAILPGISRSGTTVSLLLLRGHDGERALRLSFLLSIPAAVGAAGIAVVEAGAQIAPPTLLAMVVSGAVGYATLAALVRVARRVRFWAICVGLGALAILGGVLVVLA